ncbi:MAG: hypothetical protein LBB74_01960 [Chitinispirillales bacterium]|nr:hypothetical protein [Chitinispirillales bacterium]
MKYNENRIMLPFVMTTVYTVLTIWSSINSGMWESRKIIVMASIIWIVWLTLFIVEKAKGNVITGEKIGCIVKVFFAVVISLFCAGSVWFSGYLTLNPAGAIVNGMVHHDTVFHVTIAESIKNYGYPSLLLNDADFLHYHWGSHFILAMLSRVLNVSVFNVYNYLYPIIFIPAYSFLVMTVIVEIRKHKNETALLSVVDYAFLSFFFIGFLPAAFLNGIGIWKSSWVISESYLFALVFFLLYILLILKTRQSNRFGNMSAILLTILFIVICTAMKVSVGFLITVGAVYINFRKNLRKTQYWIINIVFLSIFLLSYKVFSEAYGYSGFQFMSFVRHYVIRDHGYIGYIGVIPHYFFLLFFTLFVLNYQRLANKPLRQAILSKKLLMEETLLVISIAGLLPGMLMDIVGGSAGYFSYFQELIAICMLLGYNIPDKLRQKILCNDVKWKINAVKFCMLLLTLFVLFNSRIDKVAKVAKIHDNMIDNRLLTNIQNVMKISRNEKIRYGIFLENSAEIWGQYKHNADIAVLFYPAFTGIRVLSRVYTDGYGVTDSVDCENMTGAIGLIPKLTFDEAKEEAKRKNINRIIHFYEDKYRIMDI